MIAITCNRFFCESGYNSASGTRWGNDLAEEAALSGEITRLLGDLRHGKPEAVDELIPLVYGQLRALARTYLKGERGDHTLQPTVLVNDALMRLLGAQSMEWQNRAHFFAVASQVMRRILIDYARSHKAEKRGGDLQRISLDQDLIYDWRQADAMIALDQALDKLEGYDPRLCKTVEMRFFGGMTEDETAEVLSVSVRTVKRDWQFARTWLYREMTRPPCI